ncbi:hypothetical protein IAD21_03514 [Abditibacteriota bacterium]|nr:hypothetical protein IAD21_03514 [Abditibacteriota bacterium]
MTNMRRFLVLAPLALLLAVPLQVQAATRRAPKGWKTYDGPWFSVFYPASWKATAGKTPAGTGGGKSDAAMFTSPDGSAQFAIYSPMWNGDPTDLNIDPKREKLVSRLVTKKKIKANGGNEMATRWQTFRALNGSYTRSIVDTENITLNARHVFGFRYKNAATYRKFLPQFQKFKASLEQYLD